VLSQIENGLIYYSLVMNTTPPSRSEHPSGKLWQQTTIEITHHDHPIIAYLHHIHIDIFLGHNPFVVHSTCYATDWWAASTTSPPFCNEPHWSHVLFLKVASCIVFISWA